MILLYESGMTNNFHCHTHMNRINSYRHHHDYIRSHYCQINKAANNIEVLYQKPMCVFFITNMSILIYLFIVPVTAHQVCMLSSLLSEIIKLIYCSIFHDHGLSLAYPSMILTNSSQLRLPSPSLSAALMICCTSSGLRVSPATTQQMETNSLLSRATTQRFVVCNHREGPYQISTIYRL